MTYIPENAPKKHHICTKIPVIPATTYINSIIAHQNHFKPPNPRHYSRTFNQTHLIIKQTHPNKPIRSKILFKITLHSPISQRNFTTRISGTAKSTSSTTQNSSEANPTSDTYKHQKQEGNT